MIAPLLLAAALHGAPVPRIPPDAIKHFFVSAFVQSVAYSALRAVGSPHGSSMAGASAASAAAGIGKELYDRRTNGRFDPRDLAWDAAGAGAATLLLTRTRR